MPRLPVNLIKGDKVDPKIDYGDSLPVNMYAVQRDILGAKGYMLSYPGLTQLGTGVGIDRGGVYNERMSRHLRVSGTKFVMVGPTGTVTQLGDISGIYQASLPYSFNTQAIIADSKMWLYSIAGGLVQVTDVNLGQPIDGVWIDGYYFLTDGEYIYHTDIDDETSVDPLKFATAEFMPDPSLGVAKTSDNRVIVFGRYSTEYFANAATENFAFQRIEQRAQKIGIVGTHAKCETDTNWYITGGRKNEALGVYILGVGETVRISTREVDKILAKYAEVQLAYMVMESRIDHGQTFVLVHLPGETLCFNETISKSFGVDYAWSILSTTSTVSGIYDGINGVYDPLNGKRVYGSKETSKLGFLDDTLTTHFGNDADWQLDTPLLNLEAASIDEVSIETIPGLNTVDDAEVYLSITKDGRTYGTEWLQTYSEPLDYGNRFIIRRLGYVPHNIGFRLRGSGSSKLAFSSFTVTYG